MVAHTGFDPRIALVGPAPAVAAAAAAIPERFAAARRMIAVLHPQLDPAITRLHLRTASSAAGVEVDLLGLRSALRG
jgi:hypothetical protein